MIDWLKIETVLLDMDGTLLDLHFDNYFWHEYLPKSWAERQGMSIDDAKAELIPMFKKEEGSLQWYCLDYWSDRLGIDIIELKQAIKHKITTRHDTLEFLEFLTQKKKAIIMVTNAHPDLIQMKFVETEIEVYFHNIVSSHTLGTAKEESVFWHKLNDEIHYEKHNTVLIDDNLNVLNSAREYGIENLISIKQPDSQKPARVINDFQAVDLFEELM